LIRFFFVAVGTDISFIPDLGLDSEF